MRLPLQVRPPDDILGLRPERAGCHIYKDVSRFSVVEGQLGTAWCLPSVSSSEVVVPVQPRGAPARHNQAVHVAVGRKTFCLASEGSVKKRQSGIASFRNHKETEMALDDSPLRESD